jgi:hypothetical protein
VRRFLLLLFALGGAISIAGTLWPRQLGGYLALFGQHTTVNRGVAVTVPAVLTVLLVAQQLRVWRWRRDLARLRREPAGLAPWGHPAWGQPWSRPAWGQPAWGQSSRSPEAARPFR